MAWTERQHALLRAMGLRLWSAPAGAAEGAVADAAPAAAGSSALAAPASAAAAPPAIPPGTPPARERAAQPLRHPSSPSSPLPPAPGAPAAAPAVQGLGWEALESAVAGCRACGLCERRTQTVFGTGHRRARWLVVGEAPGEQEDREGEPFVGAAGQLLDRMLDALGLTRSADGDEAAVPLERRVYIANTLKCRPPGNRNPAPAELATCEPYLVRQIELLEPRLILAMGRFAVQQLLGTDAPIGRLRGRVHRYQGVPLVVTYHPAYLLRNLPEKAKAWEDLCLAAEVFERGPAAP